MTVSLRAVEPHDHDFLLALYGATRQRELSQAVWGPGQLEAFLASQHRIQDAAFRGAYPRATFSVVELDGEPVGRLTVDRRDDGVHVVDIALLPVAQGLGIGSLLLRDLQQEAARAGVSVTLSVEVHNPAQRLYARLGFRPVTSSGLHRELCWRPPARVPGRSSGEDGLVAHPAVAGPQRDDEESQLAQVGVHDLHDALVDGSLDRTEEDQREAGTAAVHAGAQQGRAVQDPRLRAGRELEPLPLPAREVVVGEPLQIRHPVTVVTSGGTQS